MTFQIKSPSGTHRTGYTRRDAIYAAAILAEGERRLFSRKSKAIEVFKGSDLIATVWADAVIDHERDGDPSPSAQGAN